MVKETALDRFRPAYQPPAAPAAEVISPDGVRLAEYKAFTTSGHPSHILFKPGIRKLINTQDHALPYGALTLWQSDGNGFGLTLFYALPEPGPIVVRITGKGLNALADALLDGTCRTVQVFDPALFLPVPEGDWNTLEHKWQGVPIVDRIEIWDRNNPPPPDADVTIPKELNDRLH